MKRVAFQGERGAYSEAAAVAFFEDEIDTIPYSSFPEILESTENDKTEYSILPVENSLEGSVGESYDLLYHTSLTAVGEVYYKINHCLIGKGIFSDVDTVYSHPQALGQCRKFIQENRFKTVPTYDTAGSVNIIKDLDKKSVAAIASKNASDIYHVPVIREEIADKKNNYTRFLILSKTESEQSEQDKTSIIFSIKHEPGALFRIIEKFHKTGVNLTKIESRPKRDPVWEYNFFVDFEGHKDENKINEMLREIEKESLFFKILGSYPKASLF